MYDRAAAWIAIAALSTACGSAPPATPVMVQTETASPRPLPTPTTPVAPEVAVPGADHGMPGDAPSDAAKVALDGDRLYLDGVVIGDVKAVRESKRLERIDVLFEALKARREKWKSDHPHDPFPGNATFAFDADTPAFLVKSIFQTAAFAGFPNARFVVRGPDGALAHLPVDAFVPQPGVAPPWEPPPSATASTRTPTLRQGATTVTGKLPPEVIQRIVRQNFGRFRLCYENGLKNSPNLDGSITVKFVIGVKGDVTSAADAGSKLPDASVIGCVVRGFKNLSFPQPEGGTVTVVYPITFSPGG